MRREAMMNIKIGVRKKAAEGVRCARCLEVVSTRFFADYSPCDPRKKDDPLCRRCVREVIAEVRG
jgi:hypothetical protein